VSKLKKLVVAAEEEIKRWGKTGSLFVENAPAFSFFSPSFFYSKSQLLYQALQGSCHVYIIMVYKTGELESCLVKGGSLWSWETALAVFSVFSIHTKRSQLVLGIIIRPEEEEDVRTDRQINGCKMREVRAALVSKNGLRLNRNAERKRGG